MAHFYTELHNKINQMALIQVNYFKLNVYLLNTKVACFSV